MSCQPFSQDIEQTSGSGAPIQHARKLVAVGDCAGILRFRGCCSMEASALHGARASLSPRIFNRVVYTVADENFSSTQLDVDFALPVRAGAAIHLGQEWHCAKTRHSSWNCKVDFSPADPQPDPREPYKLAGTLISPPGSAQQTAVLVLSAHSAVNGRVRVDFSLQADAPGEGRNSAAECELFANWNRVNGRSETSFRQIDWRMEQDYEIEKGESICVVATWKVSRAGQPKWDLQGSFTPLEHGRW